MVENKLTLPVKIVISIKKTRDDEGHLRTYLTTSWFSSKDKAQ